MLTVDSCDITLQHASLIRTGKHFEEARLKRVPSEGLLSIMHVSCLVIFDNTAVVRTVSLPKTYPFIL